MKRKGMAVVVAAALCGMLTVGCSGAAKTAADAGVSSESVQSEEAADDGGVVSLTIWAEETNHEMLGRMAESFKQEYGGQAEFDIQIVSSVDAQTKSDVLSDIHNAADVFFFADDQLTSLAAGGALAKVPNADEIKAANTEGSVAAASIQDTLYAYPMTADNGYFLYYDKTYFTDEDVKTLDRILEVAAENEKKFSMEWDSGWYLYSFFGNTGLDFGINDDGVTNHCNWNTTEGDVIGADIVNAMLDIAMHPGFVNLPDSEFIAGVQDGTIIAGVSGVWNAMEIQAAWGSDYGAVKLPTFTCAEKQIQMSSFIGYKMAGANAYSDHVDWALKLADWVTNEQNQILRFEERNQGPSNIKAAASDKVEQVPAIQAVIAQSEYGVLQRVGNNYWDPFVEFGENLAAGNPSGKDSQELIDTLVAGITASTVN